MLVNIKNEGDLFIGDGALYALVNKGIKPLYKGDVKFWLPLGSYRVILKWEYSSRELYQETSIIKYTNNNGVLNKKILVSYGSSYNKCDWWKIYGKLVCQDEAERLIEVLTGFRSYPTAGEGWKLL
jgi:hypothetical protein